MKKVLKIICLELAALIFVLVLNGCGGDVDYTEAPTVEGETQNGFENNEEFPKHIDMVISDKVTVDADVNIPDNINLSDIKTYNGITQPYKTDSDYFELFEIDETKKAINIFEEEYTPGVISKRYDYDDGSILVLTEKSISYRTEREKYYSAMLDYSNYTENIANSLDCGHDLSFLTREEAESKARGYIEAAFGEDVEYSVLRVISVDGETLRNYYREDEECGEGCYVVFYNQTFDGISMPFFKVPTGETNNGFDSLGTKTYIPRPIIIDEKGLVCFTTLRENGILKSTGVAKEKQNIISPEEALEKISKSIEAGTGGYGEVFDISLCYIDFLKGTDTENPQEYEIRPVWIFSVRSSLQGITNSDNLQLSEITDNSVMTWTVDAITGDFVVSGVWPLAHNYVADTTE